MQRRQQVWPHPLLDRDPRKDEDAERGGHRRHRPPDDRAQQRTQHEGEERVADRHDVARVEDSPHAVVRAVESAVPPRDRECQHTGDQNRRAADERELRQHPALAAHGLGPREPVGAGLELAGDKRSAPEDADEGGRNPQQEHQRVLQEAVVPEELVHRQAAAVGRDARCDQLVIEMRQVDAGDPCRDRERGEEARNDKRLRLGLQPGEAGHDATASPRGELGTPSRACFM